MTLRPVPRAAERNKAALARARAGGYTLLVEDHGMAETFVVKPGIRYQVWASAGAYVDCSREGLLVGFSCQCKGGAATTYGVTGCKHSGLLAEALYQAGVVAIDVDGAYIATAKAATAPSMLTLAALLLPCKM